MDFSKNNHEHLNGTRRNVSRTTMKFFVCLITAIALMAITSCQKDNLEDAVLPQTAQGEGGQVASGADGQNGQNGQDGAVGTQGEPGANGQDGEDGAQGEPGTDGQDGQDGEDGAQGPIGPQGEPGTNGTDGTDGAQGPRGEQGETGANGTSGEDGNANVRSFTYSLRSVTDTHHTVPIPELTSNVLNNDVVLTYLKFTTLTYAIPAHISVGFGGGRSFRADVDVYFRVGTCHLSFREQGENYVLRTPPRAGDLQTLRVVIIKSSSVTFKTTKQNVQQELKAAGVDINNYDQVANYYGLN